MTPENVTKQISNLAFMFDLSEPLKPGIVSALNEVSQIERVAPDTVILSPGESSSDAGFVLLAGSVEIQSPDGFTRSLDPPVILGEMKQFHFDPSGKRMVTVRTLCEVTVLRFVWTDLYALLSKRISAKEVEEFRLALQEHAWMHYLELQDEL
ncbi:MAG: cyclic nucleotide-binding domain-containing protein [Candidatus Hydrogenedentes bacterium]|nr:cyclic nucleotide-binding domain-containing protein [Candidatus Hydrogenedentota bacterium]